MKYSAVSHATVYPSPVRNISDLADVGMIVKRKTKQNTSLRSVLLPKVSISLLKKGIKKNIPKYAVKYQ